MKFSSTKTLFKFLAVISLFNVTIFIISCDFPIIKSEPSSQKSQVPTQTPIPLQITKENKGKRCEFTQYNISSENPYCYKLQEQLVTSSEKGNLEEMKKALALGANVDAGYYQSFSALYHASMSGQREAADLLINNGANVNRIFTFGQTPLKASVYYNHLKVVEILIEHGADLCDNSVNDDNRKNTALDIAQEQGFSEIEKMLLQKGAANCQ
jgi:hypothetical protein